MYLFLERGEGTEKEGEKHQCVVASCVPPIGDLAHNPDMYPDWESNQQCFGSQATTQSTEPHQPGLKINFLKKFLLFEILHCLPICYGPPLSLSMLAV